MDKESIISIAEGNTPEAMMELTASPPASTEVKAANRVTILAGSRVRFTVMRGHPRVPRSR